MRTETLKLAHELYSHFGLKSFTLKKANEALHPKQITFEDIVHVRMFNCLEVEGNTNERRLIYFYKEPANHYE